LSSKLFQKPPINSYINLVHKLNKVNRRYTANYYHFQSFLYYTSFNLHADDADLQNADNRGLQIHSAKIRVPILNCIPLECISTYLLSYKYYHSEFYLPLNINKNETNMKKLGLLFLLFLALMVIFRINLYSQANTKLSTMPRIDVHAHVGGIDRMADFMEVRKVLKEKFNEDLAMWVNLQFPLGPRMEGKELIKQAEEKYQGRFVPTINDFKIADGLRFSPEEIAEWQSNGVAGYKIWVGVSEAIDNPANEPTFIKMEQIGMIGASIHISQPYPRNCKDPVLYWGSINAWERVLDRHPKMVVVCAHMMDIFYSDEQLDYLQYFLERYPNVYVDVAARLKDFPSMSNEKIRNFFIKYSDRILFGTDISDQPKAGRYQEVAEAYDRCFKILETDGVFTSEFFNPEVKGRTIKGISLPMDVLEKIYYRNAMKLYPGLKNTLKKLGYNVE
jgi:predicted TIM-barrel fold metal-dependent hydrolase